MSSFVNVPYTALIDKYPPAPPGYEDHWFVHWYEIAVNANQLITQLPLQIETDADFYWRALMGSLDYQFLILFRDPWGNPLASSLDVAENLIAISQPGEFWPEIKCPRGSTPTVTIQEYSGNSGTLKLALVGVKRYPHNA